MLVLALARGLRDAGVDARFISIYSDKLDPNERANLGVPLVTIGRRSRSDVGFFGRLRSAVRAERPDIVHAHLSAGKYAGRLAAVLEGVPTIVFTEHDDERVGPIPFAINRFLHARTACFITFSPEHRARVARNARIPLDKIVVIPNGVAVPPAGDRAALRHELGLPADAFALYLPARLVAQKNQALALRAFAMLAQREPSWQLILAGAGELETELEALARDLAISDRIRFLGYRADAPLLLSAMDAFVMSSLDERMPLALAEAMRAGVAVVTTPWKGVDAVVRDGETGFVAADFSVDAFASSLQRLRDGRTRAAVTEAAKTFADERFDLRVCVRSHVELYERLIAARR